jgi:predicted acetyltransferase
MPTFDIIKKAEPNQTFRVASVMGKFDLQSNKIEERFTGSIDMPDEWQIGMIIGKSGSGKTTIAKQLFPEKQFIAVSCHYDIEDWLLPDWVFDTNDMTFRLCEGQKKNRPEIKCKIYETKDKAFWSYFARFHYLNHSHHGGAKIYLITINDTLAGFCSILHFPHPKVKNMKKVHRLVILPDFQGIGIGVKFIDSIANINMKNKNRFAITTSSPSLIKSLCSSNKWNATSIGRKSPHSNMKISSSNRVTASFEYHAKS